VTALEALVAAVAVEHQVIYGYGLAGARLVGHDRLLTLAALDAHRSRRDQLAALVARRSATPPPAAAAYRPPLPIVDVSSARALCAALEDACAGAAWDLVAASARATTERALAVGWLTAAASAAAQWRRGTVTPVPPLPGQPR
jgi:hypothetical protein